MRRTNEAYKSELFRRAENHRLQKRTKRLRVALICLPFFVCVLSAGWIGLRSTIRKSDEQNSASSELLGLLIDSTGMEMDGIPDKLVDDSENFVREPMEPEANIHEHSFSGEIETDIVSITVTQGETVITIEKAEELETIYAVLMQAKLPQNVVGVYHEGERYTVELLHASGAYAFLQLEGNRLCFQNADAFYYVSEEWLASFTAALPG